MKYLPAVFCAKKNDLSDGVSPFVFFVVIWTFSQDIFALSEKSALLIYLTRIETDYIFTWKYLHSILPVV